MKDPERLLQGGATETERRLLEAGFTEEPSSQSIRNAAAAIGLGAAAGLTAHSAVGASATAAAMQATSTFKWLGIGLFGVGVVATAGYIVARRTVHPPNTEPLVQTASPPSVALRAKPSSAPVVPEPEVVEEKQAESTAPTNSSKSPRTPKTTPGRSLKDQISLVDRARHKLGSGQPRAALTALDQYRQLYPNGALGQEAMLLRIEALSQLGNSAAARSLATRFLRRQPKSLHRKRIESLVGKINLPADP